MRAPIPILHQDEHLLVASKPPGVLSVRTPGADSPSLPEMLAGEGFDVVPVHRLDRDVSGAILFAKDERTRAALEELFRARALRKVYWALAQGRVKPSDGAWTHPILEEAGFARVSALGKPSTTRYRTLRAFATTTELEVDLVTGRYNQIRLHAAHAGFPLVGERKYARGKDSPVRAKSRRVALHAWRLELPHPITGERLAIEAPLPDDLVELLDRASEAKERPSAPRSGERRRRRGPR